MFDRLIQPELARSRRSVLLLGPRQVGKSTLLGSLGPDLVLNFASPAVFRSYVARPERFEAEMRAAPPRIRTVLLDEVQRIPAILDAVQVLIDESPRRMRFLMSGSSARKLRRGQANLLPGRVHVRHLHPLLARELGDAFDLERSLAQGTLPGIWAEADPATRAADLRSYADSYLREEIQAEALVRDIGGYARLLDLVAASSGKILNLASLSLEAGLSYETARRYVEILEDTLVAFRVPAWSGSDRASLVAHPKLFLFDVGVRNVLLRRPLDRVLDDERGLLLEHVVAYELARRIPEVWPEAKLSYFRTRGGAEVDFVLELGRDVWAIEVKSARDVRNPDSAGFRGLAERTARLRRRIVVYLGARPMKAQGIDILPLEQFLEQLPG